MAEGPAFSDGVDPTLSPGVSPPDRLGTTTLPDGRRLGWSEWGPPGGTPVLLCPGAATSRRLGFGGEVLDDLDVRLVSVDRPGLGGRTRRGHLPAAERLS